MQLDSNISIFGQKYHYADVREVSTELLNISVTRFFAYMIVLFSPVPIIGTAIGIYWTGLNLGPMTIVFFALLALVIGYIISSYKLVSEENWPKAWFVSVLLDTPEGEKIVRKHMGSYDRAGKRFLAIKFGVMVYRSDPENTRIEEDGMFVSFPRIEKENND